MVGIFVFVRSMNSGLSTISRFRVNSFKPCLITKRWFDWDPRVGKKGGKPAITGSKSLYVSSLIPIILIKDTPGLGSKGEICEVRRGFARNFLVPEGFAVYGTTWENVDSFADQRILSETTLEGETTAKRTTAPFQWINSVSLEFLRETLHDQRNHARCEVTEPVTIADLLISLSSLENVDLLPSHLILPEEGITTVGTHWVPVKLTVGYSAYSYSLRVDVKDKAEVVASERRETELREAMKLKRPDFVLGTSRFSEAGIGSNLSDKNVDDEHSPMDLSSDEEM